MLILKKHDPDVFSTVSVAEIPQEIEGALSIMKCIGKNSLITQNAGRCIERLLSVFDTLGIVPSTVTYSLLNARDGH